MAASNPRTIRKAADSLGIPLPELLMKLFTLAHPEH
jgi:hypothetical protein